MILDLSKGLVGHWTFDDRDIQGGTIHDRSASDYHLPLDSSVTAGHDCPIGTAAEFDGSTRGPSIGTEEYLQTDRDVTVTGWINPRQPVGQHSSHWSSMIGRGSTGNAAGIDFSDSGHVQFMYRDADNNRRTARESYVIDFNNPRWVFVAGVNYGDSDTSELWIDGELKASDTSSNVGQLTGGTIRLFDDRTTAGNRAPYDGFGSDVRLYDRALSAGEIRALSNMRSPRRQTMDLSRGLVGHWSMDERDIDGGTMRDRSGYGHHAAMSSGITTGHESPVGTACGWDGSHEGATTPHTDILNTFTEGITVACWIYSQQYAIDGYDYIINKGVFSGATFFCVLEKAGGHGLWRIGSVDGYESIHVPLEPDQWVHGAMTWDQETGDWHTYSDGELARSKTFTADELLPNTNPVDIGEGGSNLVAHLSDLRLYNRALSSAEIRQLADMRRPREVIA